MVRVVGEGDHIASGNDAGASGSQRNHGLADGERGRGRGGIGHRASGAYRDAGGFANREPKNVEQGSTAKGVGGASIAHVGELREAAESSTSGGVDNEAPVGEGRAVIFQNFADLGHVGKLGGAVKGDGARGAVSAGSAEASNGADVRLNSVADGAESLGEHIVHGGLIRADVLQLLHVLAAQGNADVGDLADGGRCVGNSLVVAARDSHRGRVAGIQRGLRGNETVDGAVDRDLGRIRVHQNGGNEADKLARNGVTSAEDVLRETGKCKGVSHCSSLLRVE